MPTAAELRRLRMPLPAAARDHVAACPTSGVLRTRAVPAERAIARVCREAGGRVAMHVRVAEMNVDVPVSDARRIEILASALPVWHGAQVAIDATMVSPEAAVPDKLGLCLSKRRAKTGDDLPGAVYGTAVPARRLRHQGRRPVERRGGICSVPRRGSSLSGCVPQHCRPFTSAGPALLPLRRSGPSPPPSLACLARARLPWMELRRPCPRC